MRERKRYRRDFPGCENEDEGTTKEQSRQLFFMATSRPVIFGVLFLWLGIFSGFSLFAWQESAGDTIIAEGRYLMGDRDSRNDAKEYALLDAKKKVMEQAGTFIRSSTTVKNFQMSDQEIQAYTAGLIRTEILEERFEPVGETMAAVVTIRAVVNLQEIAQQLSEMQSEGELTEDISLLQSEYQQAKAQIDSLQAAPVHERQKNNAARRIAWRKLRELDLLTRLAMEARRRQPNVGYMESLVTQFQRIHPRITFVDGYLGVAYFKHHQVGKAVSHLEKAVQKTTPRTRKGFRKSRRPMSGDYAERFRRELALFHYYLAKGYRQQGKRAKAIRHLALAKQLNPTGKFQDLE